MVVDSPAPIASSLAPLPAPPAPLLVVMTINSNSRIIPTPAFIPKALLAAIAAKPIPCRYTGSTETRPSVWINAEKARDLADRMDVTLIVLMLKRLETHVYNDIHPPQDHSLKWRSPSPNFVFTEDEFPYLSGSRTPSKRQRIDDGTISLGSPTPHPDFARDFDTDYFVSVPKFLDYESNANYIEQSLVWQHNLTSPQYFSLYKNIFYCSVPVGLYGLIASAHPTGVQYNFIDKCSYSRCKQKQPQKPQWLLDSGASMHFTGQWSNLVDAFKLAQPLMIQMANNVTQVKEARTVFITYIVLPRNGKAYEKTTRLQPVYYLNRLNTCLLSMGEFLNDKQLITSNNRQLMSLRNKLPVLTCQPHVVGSTTFWLNSTIESVQSLSAKTRMVYATDYSIWHQRMGHPGDNILWKLPWNGKRGTKANHYTHG